MKWYLEVIPELKQANVIVTLPDEGLLKQKSSFSTKTEETKKTQEEQHVVEYEFLKDGYLRIRFHTSPEDANNENAGAHNDHDGDIKPTMTTICAEDDKQVAMTKTTSTGEESSCGVKKEKEDDNSILFYVGCSEKTFYEKWKVSWRLYPDHKKMQIIFDKNSHFFDDDSDILICDDFTVRNISCRECGSVLLAGGELDGSYLLLYS